MAKRIDTQSCIVGGGPAGLMLGFLLARSGVNTVVLEKHQDFLRDFRGDTIHPSTMELMYELGMLDAFLKLPHQKVSRGFVYVNGEKIPGPDFTHLSTQAKFIAMMPQWNFLNFIVEKAGHYPCFDLKMSAMATGLIVENEEVKGVIAELEDGQLEIRADLTVGSDGRSSTVRALAGLAVTDYGSPIDVLWFRLPKPTGQLPELTAYTAEGYFLVIIDRGDYYQNAFLVHKNGFEAIKSNGLDWFKDRVCRLQPAFLETLDSLMGWEQVKLLNVQVSCLQQWYCPGLLCIGDAAHAMSPVGGVGINLAIQDAVATANLLADKLREGNCKPADLRAVQDRRAWQAKMTQRLQVEAHKRFFSSQKQNRPVAVARPLVLFLRLFAFLFRWIFGWIIGIGFRPEHIQAKVYQRGQAPSDRLH